MKVGNCAACPSRRDSGCCENFNERSCPGQGKPKEFEVYLKKNFMLYFAVNFGRQI